MSSITRLATVTLNWRAHRCALNQLVNILLELKVHVGSIQIQLQKEYYVVNIESKEQIFFLVHVYMSHYSIILDDNNNKWIDLSLLQSNTSPIAASHISL